jgi:indole-3-glycerol phosphate synthase
VTPASAALQSRIDARRAALRTLGPIDVRGVTPSIKDFQHSLAPYPGALAVIAELARATPEEGALAADYSADTLVPLLDEAEVAAIAVAIDPACDGYERDLARAAAITTTPVLARDLVLTRDQLYAARLHGADAVLLTASVVPAGELKSMLEIASSMHLAAPIEVQSPEELATAVACGARWLVLPAFDARGALSLAAVEALLPSLPRTVSAIARGPFARPQDFEPLRNRVAAVWLCGPLMRATDRLEFLRPLVQAAEGNV